MAVLIEGTGEFVGRLEAACPVFHDGSAFVEIAVVDQRTGPTYACAPAGDASAAC